MALFTVHNLLDTLATAFGGWSQFTDEVVGVAIAGHFNNGGNLTAAYTTPEEAIAAASSALCERWWDLEAYQDEGEVEARVAAGFRRADRRPAVPGVGGDAATLPPLEDEQD